MTTHVRTSTSSLVSSRLRDYSNKRRVLANVHLKRSEFRSENEISQFYGSHCNNHLSARAGFNVFAAICIFHRFQNRLAPFGPPPAAITGDHGVCQDCQVRLALCRDAEISRYRIRSTTISDEISRYSGAARKTNRAHALDIKTDWMLKCAEASKVHSHAHKPPSQRMDWTGKGGGRRRAKGADGAQPHVATFVHLRASRARHADRAQASVFLSFCSLCRGFEKSKARKREPCRHVLAALAIARSVRLTRFD